VEAKKITKYAINRAKTYRGTKRRKNAIKIRKFKQKYNPFGAKSDLAK